MNYFMFHQFFLQNDNNWCSGRYKFDTLRVVKPSWQTSCDCTSFICIPRLALPRSIQLSRPGSVSSPTMHAVATVSVLQMLG